MLHYLQHVKKPLKLAQRDFTGIWDEILWHTLFLETNYKGNLDESDRKLMYIRVYPKAYHQKCIAQGKIFKQMSKLDI